VLHSDIGKGCSKLSNNLLGMGKEDHGAAADFNKEVQTKRDDD